MLYSSNRINLGREEFKNVTDEIPQADFINKNIQERNDFISPIRNKLETIWVSTTINTQYIAEKC